MKENAKEKNQRKKPRRNFDMVKTFGGWGKKGCLQQVNTYAQENNLRIVSLSEPDISFWGGSYYYEYTVVFDIM